MFDDEALEVLIKSNKSENKFVGGENRWAYDSFTNWEFWWNKFPVLVYFKVQTSSISASFGVTCVPGNCMLVQPLGHTCMLFMTLHCVSSMRKLYV